MCVALKYFLATILLSTDVPSNVWLEATVRPEIDRLAIAAQIMDPLEQTDHIDLAQQWTNFWYFNVVPPSNLMTLRNRERHLRGLPRLEEHERWPMSRNRVQELMGHNRELQRWLLHVASISALHREEAKLVLQETNMLYAMLNSLSDAKHTAYYIMPRRVALGRLRELMGPTDFAIGTDIPCVPFWRLPEQ